MIPCVLILLLFIGLSGASTASESLSNNRCKKPEVHYDIPVSEDVRQATQKFLDAIELELKKKKKDSDDAEYKPTEHELFEHAVLAVADILTNGNPEVLLQYFFFTKKIEDAACDEEKLKQILRETAIKYYGASTHQEHKLVLGIAADFFSYSEILDVLPFLKEKEYTESKKYVDSILD